MNSDAMMLISKDIVLDCASAKKSKIDFSKENDCFCGVCCRARSWRESREGASAMLVLKASSKEIFCRQRLCFFACEDVLLHPVSRFATFRDASTSASWFRFSNFRFGPRTSGFQRPRLVPVLELDSRAPAAVRQWGSLRQPARLLALHPPEDLLPGCAGHCCRGHLSQDWDRRW